MTQLRPAARQLSPTLVERGGASRPTCAACSRDLGPLIKVSGKGLPALDGHPGRQPAAAGPVRALPAHAAAHVRLPGPVQARDHRPAGQRRRHHAGRGPRHQHQQADPLPAHHQPDQPRGPGHLPEAPAQQPLEPVPRAGRATASSPRGLPTFGSYLCANPGPATFLGPPERNPLLTDNLRRLVEKYAYTPYGVVSPSCREQAPLGRLVGQSGRFPQLQPIPAP